MSDHYAILERMFDAEAPAPPGLLPGVPWSQFEPSGLLTDLLSSLDVGGVDADDALETAAGWERLIAHAHAQQLRALARFATLRAGTDLDEFATAEVAPVCICPAARPTRGCTWPPGCRPNCPTPSTLFSPGQSRPRRVTNQPDASTSLTVRPGDAHRLGDAVQRLLDGLQPS